MSSVRQDVDANEARKDAIVASALDCIIVIDAGGLILEWNPAAERTFGVPAAEAIGREMAAVIVPPELRAAHRAGLERYLATAQARMLDRRIETTAVRRDGSVFPVELAITRIDVPGPPVFTGHLRDITDRKQAEEELRASRARLVSVAVSERRRLERDLHDGAQQRLVALALDLRLARETMAADPDGAGELVEQAIADLRDAITELRELARGIHPAILTEHGLGAALPELGRRCPFDVDLSGVSPQRFAPEVEATIYFLVAEALTNAARYAEASRVSVAVSECGSGDGVADSWVAVTVSDDGRGGADPSRGSGLSGMADRVEAVGGTFTVRSGAGAGTTIGARIPCA